MDENEIYRRELRHRFLAHIQSSAENVRGSRYYLESILNAQKDAALKSIDMKQAHEEAVQRLAQLQERGGDADRPVTRAKDKYKSMICHISPSFIQDLKLDPKQQKILGEKSKDSARKRESHKRIGHSNIASDGSTKSGQSGKRPSRKVGRYDLRQLVKSQCRFREFIDESLEHLCTEGTENASSNSRLAEDPQPPRNASMREKMRRRKYETRAIHKWVPSLGPQVPRSSNNSISKREINQLNSQSTFVAIIDNSFINFPSSNTETGSVEAEPPNVFISKKQRRGDATAYDRYRWESFLDVDKPTTERDVKLPTGKRTEISNNLTDMVDSQNNLLQFVDITLKKFPISKPKTASKEAEKSSEPPGLQNVVIREKQRHGEATACDIDKFKSYLSTEENPFDAIVKLQATSDSKIEMSDDELNTVNSQCKLHEIIHKSLKELSSTKISTVSEEATESVEASPPQNESVSENIGRDERTIYNFCQLDNYIVDEKPTTEGILKLRTASNMQNEISEDELTHLVRSHCRLHEIIDKSLKELRSTKIETVSAEAKESVQASQPQDVPGSENIVRDEVEAKTSDHCKFKSNLDSDKASNEGIRRGTNTEIENRKNDLNKSVEVQPKLNKIRNTLPKVSPPLKNISIAQNIRADEPLTYDFYKWRFVLGAMNKENADFETPSNIENAISGDDLSTTAESSKELRTAKTEHVSEEAKESLEPLPEQKFSVRTKNRREEATNDYSHTSYLDAKEVRSEPVLKSQNSSESLSQMKKGKLRQFLKSQRKKNELSNEKIRPISEKLMRSKKLSPRYLVCTGCVRCQKFRKDVMTQTIEEERDSDDDIVLPIDVLQSTVINPMIRRMRHARLKTLQHHLKLHELIRDFPRQIHEICQEAFQNWKR